MPRGAREAKVVGDILSREMNGVTIVRGKKVREAGVLFFEAPFKQ